MTKGLAHLVVIFAILAGRSVAQCVPESIETDRVEGYLVFGYGEIYRVLSSDDKAKIAVLNRWNKKQVAATYPNENGKFALSGIKSGTYFLVASANRMISSTVQITLHHAPSNHSARNENAIFAVLGADATHECGGSSITVRSNQEIARILPHPEARSEYVPVIPTERTTTSGSKPK